MPRQAWLLLLLLPLLTLACASPRLAAPPPAQPTPVPEAPVALGAPEYHALWVDAFHEGIHSRAEIDRLLATAHAARLNALFVQVRKAGDAYYLRSLEPVAWDIFAPPDFDPLEYLLRKAHAANPRIEVHAWVNTFYVGSHSQALTAHPEWTNRRADGSPGPYVDPGDPAAAAYTQQVLLHLAQSYDLDGLHLDFVRYPEGGDWGYSPAAVARFDASIGAGGPPDPNDVRFDQWRRDQVTGFVAGLYRELAQVRPRLKLSAALIPWGSGPAGEADWRQTRAYFEVYQDWHEWLRQGILDLAVVMNYDTEWIPRSARWFDQWIEWEKDNQFSRKLLIGVGAYFNYPEDTLAQIRRALAPSAQGNRAAGVALYSYASTSLYGTDDYFANPQAAASLPRQPYAAGLDPAGLRERARQFNDAFWALLTQPGSYPDPVRGPVATQPVWSEWPAIPVLPWKAG